MVTKKRLSLVFCGFFLMTSFGFVKASETGTDRNKINLLSKAFVVADKENVVLKEQVKKLEFLSNFNSEKIKNECQSRQDSMITELREKKINVDVLKKWGSVVVIAIVTIYSGYRAVDHFYLKPRREKEEALRLKKCLKDNLRDPDLRKEVLQEIKEVEEEEKQKKNKFSKSKKVKK
ncbi:hypothetical protein KAH94_03430 [bacterium]|nr:hypothetical protein [bacterium]